MNISLRGMITDHLSDTIGIGIECEEGGTHSGKLWQLRKKLFPNSRDPPTAMLDSEGNLLTCEKKLEEISLDAYKETLKNRPTKEIYQV